MSRLKANSKCFTPSTLPRSTMTCIMLCALLNILLVSLQMQSIAQVVTEIDDKPHGIYVKKTNNIPNEGFVVRNESKILENSLSRKEMKQKESEIKTNAPKPSSNKEKEGLKILKRDAVMGGNGWQMGSIVVESYRLVFCFIPKVGCSVFKKLFRRMMGAGNWRNYPHFQHGDLKTLRDYNSSMAVEMMTSPDWTRAVFFRDPKERLLSAFLDKAFSDIFSETYIMKQCCQCAEGEANCTIRDQNKRWVLYLDGCKERLQVFENFVNHIEKGGCAKDPHWRPQTDRIDNKFLKYIDFVGHMDTISEDTEKLLRMIGAWDQFGSNGWGENGTESIFQSNGADHATDAKGKLKQYYTPALERAAERIYIKDYEHPFFNATLSGI